MSEEIIVTGATGFIGRHIVAELARAGFQVHALSRKPLLDTVPNITAHQIDLLNHVATAELLNDIKAKILIHAAWYTKPKLYWESELNLDWVASSLHLFKHFCNCGGSRIVGIGSCAEYIHDKELFVENDALEQPETLYGTCKLRLYEVASKFCQKKELSFSWARLFFLYGADEQDGRLLPSLMDHITNGAPLGIRDWHCLRDFLHVNDAASALASLALSRLEGPINICSGSGIPVGTFVQSVFEAVGQPCTVTSEITTVSPAPRSLVGCNKRLSEELGWRPNSGFKERLLETVKSYIDNPG